MKIRVNIIKYLANLKFAIVLLIVIASLSILGTVIEQDQTIEFYKINYQQTLFNIKAWQIIIQFGLNNIFKTSWFIGLLIIFPPTRKLIFKRVSTKQNFNNKKNNQDYINGEFEDLDDDNR